MFDDIRPFNDSEAKAVLKETLNDPALANALGSWIAPKANRSVPWLIQPLIKTALKLYTWNVNSIQRFQMKLEPLLLKLLKRSVESWTVNGLDKLDPTKAYLFVSNHRDIVMDPAMVNLALYQNGYQTVRIAIGDNLLTQPFSSNLMRLNKSFIVKRGLKGMKERLRAAQTLSKYIHFSILEENANVWIAQREGRAKDGYDRTNTAVIGMFSLSRPKERLYKDYINELNIVPVAISYELDPLDISKAKEIHAHQTEGSYKKRKNEDMRSIARGMTGWKGRIHLEFGDVIHGEFENDGDVAVAIDKQIQRLFKPFETHQWAMQTLQGGDDGSESSNSNVLELKKRVEAIADELKPYILKQYANGIRMNNGEPPL